METNKSMSHNHSIPNPHSEKIFIGGGGWGSIYRSHNILNLGSLYYSHNIMNPDSIFYKGVQNIMRYFEPEFNISQYQNIILHRYSALCTAVHTDTEKVPVYQCTGNTAHL
jgi:hypothetical protein